MPARRPPAHVDPPDVGEVRAAPLPTAAEDEPVALCVVEGRTGSEPALGPLQALVGRRRRAYKESGHEKHDQRTNEGNRSHARLTAKGVSLFRDQRRAEKRSALSSVVT
jgi:hypothetical protein